MKTFEAEISNICTAAVRPLRSKDAARIVAALGAIAPPLADDVAAELIALGFAHHDANVRKRAMAIAAKHVADLASFKAAYKSLANQQSHVIEQRVRAFAHPYQLDIAKALLFHRMAAATIAFERDAAVRAAILEVALDRAQREGESELKLGEVYWYWRNNGGWATSFDHHVLPRELFGEITRLRARHPVTGLSLWGGSLTDLPDDIIECKPWLTSLSLAFNPFTEIPPVVWELENLESLQLLGTELVDIPTDIAKLPKLRRLDIGNMKKMKEIPASVCALAKLEWLRIGNGSIRKVPDAIAGMTSLRELELQSTSVAKLPPCITEMPGLKTINVRWSKVPKDTIDALNKAGVRVEV